MKGDAIAGVLASGEKAGALSESLAHVIAIREVELAGERNRLITMIGWGVYGLVLLLIVSRIIGFYTSYLGRFS